MSIGFKITEKVKEDFQATIDFWKAASESQDLDFFKDRWEHYDEIRLLSYGCAFCEYFNGYCDLCPLGKTLGKCPSKYINSSYNNWSHAKSIKSKQSAAKEIYEFCLAWCDQNIFNQKRVCGWADVETNI